MKLFKGYVPTKNKQCQMKFKNASSSDLLTYEQVKDLPEYAGILNEETVLIDIDDSEQSEKLMKLVEDHQLDCKVIDTTRGKHFYFKNPIDHPVTQCYTHVHLAIGLVADIKIGSKASYAVLKFAGEERFCEWDLEEPDAENYQELPYYLKPIKTRTDLLNLADGDGRNSTLFGYELTLQSAGLTKEETKETIRLINQYVLKEPLEDQELETILRDEAFLKPVFFDGKKFLHAEFAKYLQSEFNVKRINGQLHVYSDGIYVSGYRILESKMIEVMPDMKQTQRTEVLKYLEISIPENTFQMNDNLIAFNNGIYDLSTGSLLPFNPEYIITNKIPWNYVPDAYYELTDITLNKIACGNQEIRKLLEECIGYTFFRSNKYQKAFLLTGDGSNGKSTYLEAIENVLGRQNYVSLDIDELSEKFSTSSLFGKLANIGDDITDEFLQGKAVAQFKKIVSGNDIKAENKGQDVFFFKPSIKLLFSANEIPRFRNKGFYAIERRMVIIPFEARFSDKDKDYNPNITWELQTQESAEYLIKIGIDGLKRIIDHGFTVCSKVTEQIKQFKLDNNPLLLFLEELDADVDILHKPTREVFARYDTYCSESGYQRMTQANFTKEIAKQYGFKAIQKRTPKGKVYVYERC